MMFVYFSLFIYNSDNLLVSSKLHRYYPKIKNKESEPTFEVENLGISLLIPRLWRE